MNISKDRMLQGLIRKEYCPYYQPLWNVRSRRVDRAEVLLRWQYSKDLLLNPIELLTHFAAKKFMSTLGYNLFDAICRDFAVALNSRSPLQGVSINFSYRELVEPGFVEAIVGILRKHRMAASLFTIEITESHAFEDIGKLQEVILELKEFGFKFALDDFCTGYSCFDHMSQLSVDELKLDRHFISKIRHGNRFFHICRELVDMVELVNMEIIAEGIETAEQQELLQAAGIHYLQGFHYGRAMPIGQLLPALLPYSIPVQPPVAVSSGVSFTQPLVFA